MPQQRPLSKFRKNKKNPQFQTQRRRGEELLAPNLRRRPEMGIPEGKACGCAALTTLPVPPCWAAPQFLLYPGDSAQRETSSQGSREQELHKNNLGGKNPEPQTTHTALARSFPCSRGCFIHHLIHHIRGWEARAASVQHRKSITTGGKLNNRSNCSPRRCLVTAEANRGSLFTYLPFPTVVRVAA